jgi:hypothetical protein
MTEVQYPLAVRHADRVRAAANRRRLILKLLASGLSRPKVAGNLGISKQRLAVILRQLPAADLEAALATGAGKVRCPHCGLFVAPREAGRPHRPENRIRS